MGVVGSRGGSYGLAGLLPAVLAVLLVFAVPAGLSSAAAADRESCQARSGPVPPAVVELYTSEGCSSCPPADRWLAGVAKGGEVVALAFHVSYWNHLGWQDPFATEATTGRQYRFKEATGAAYVYTPQVLLNGRDWRGWRGRDPSGLPRLPAGDAPALRLSRAADRVTAEISPSAAGGRLAGYWAVLADGLVSRVGAGENAGRTLEHDHVVSHYLPVDPWDASAGQQVTLTLPDAGRGRRVSFVVTDSRLIRPVQAVVLSCD